MCALQAQPTPPKQHQRSDDVMVGFCSQQLSCPKNGRSEENIFAAHVLSPRPWLDGFDAVAGTVMSLLRHRSAEALRCCGDLNALAKSTLNARWLGDVGGDAAVGRGQCKRTHMASFRNGWAAGERHLRNSKVQSEKTEPNKSASRKSAVDS